MLLHFADFCPLRSGRDSGRDAELGVEPRRGNYDYCKRRQSLFLYPSEVDPDVDLIALQSHLFRELEAESVRPGLQSA